MPKVTESTPTRRERIRDSLAYRVGEQVASYRKARHLKVSELARGAGVSPSLISQIERGQSQPSVSTLFALAETLEAPVDAFFYGSDRRPALKPKAPATEAARFGADGDPGDQAAPGRYVVRRDRRAAIDIEGGVRWERLTRETLPGVDFLELRYEAGAQSDPELYWYPGTEMVLMLGGRLDVFVGVNRYELNTGDSVCFPSSVLHQYINPTDDVARAVMVILHEGNRRLLAEGERPGP